MANVTTSIRMDADTKKLASELLNELGLDLSSAINIFLKQVVLHGGLPFEVKYPQYKAEVIEAMEEAKAISRNPETKTYKSFSEALEDIDL
ncbi:type II toxin-antitoxin system RelB/DinJ family antitoxin [Frisingicoccus sp.]|uniref:type II toxin-antitoxin system RelB/DinJ family antitoxin n=1 Tax=Frisingicoccus sp. TaxID=1918627 RepID=UPI003AB59C30